MVNLSRNQIPDIALFSNEVWLSGGSPIKSLPPQQNGAPREAATHGLEQDEVALLDPPVGTTRI